MTEYVPRITAQIGDPDQEHIDAAVAHMSPATLADHGWILIKDEGHEGANA